MACCRRLERLYRRISRPSRVGRALPPPQQHQGLIVSLGQAVGELADGAGDLVQQLMDRPVALAAKEYKLLVKLASQPLRVFTKDELLRDVWGFRSLGRTRTLDSHASRLRRKLAGAGAEDCVLNVWGVGYRLLAEYEEVARTA